MPKPLTPALEPEALLVLEPEPAPEAPPALVPAALCAPCRHHTELEILLEQAPPVITHPRVRVPAEQAQYQATVKDELDDEDSPAADAPPPIDPEDENAINKNMNYAYSFYTTDDDCKEMGNIGVAFVNATDPEP